MKNRISCRCIITILLINTFPLFNNLFAQPVAQGLSPGQLVKKMYDRYHKNWYRTLSFTQDTEIFRNDSLIRKSVWYEKAKFPELRIDVDSVSGGNKIFYLKDSTYRIRNHKIISATVDPNPFVFFLGGMYMMPYDSVISTLKKNGYELSAAATTQWKGRKTFVIGSGNANDSSKNQFWVDAEYLYIVRVQINSNNSLLDVHLSGHKRIGKAWCETEVIFTAMENYCRQKDTGIL